MDPLQCYEPRRVQFTSLVVRYEPRKVLRASYTTRSSFTSRIRGSSDQQCILCHARGAQCFLAALFALRMRVRRQTPTLCHAFCRYMYCLCKLFSFHVLVHVPRGMYSIHVAASAIAFLKLLLGRMPRPPGHKGIGVVIQRGGRSGSAGGGWGYRHRERRRRRLQLPRSWDSGVVRPCCH